MLIQSQHQRNLNRWVTIYSTYFVVIFLFAFVMLSLQASNSLFYFVVLLINCVLVPSMISYEIYRRKELKLAEEMGRYVCSHTHDMFKMMGGCSDLKRDGHCDASTCLKNFDVRQTVISLINKEVTECLAIDLCMKVEITKYKLITPLYQLLLNQEVSNFNYRYHLFYLVYNLNTLYGLGSFNPLTKCFNYNKFIKLIKTTDDYEIVKLVHDNINQPRVIPCYSRNCKCHVVVYHLIRTCLTGNNYRTNNETSNIERQISKQLGKFDSSGPVNMYDPTTKSMNTYSDLTQNLDQSRRLHSELILKQIVTK